MMKKSTFPAICFALLCFNSFAQQQDSVNVSATLRNKIFAADSAAVATYHFATKSPFFLKDIPTGFNLITIGHSYADGDYIESQSAGKVSNTYLQTEGKTVLGDVSLWGAFSFQRSREDSTRWAHQTRNNPSAPLYFGSPAMVNYHRTVYQFKAAASRNMIGNNLPVGIGLDYRIGDHYSTNDPRGQVSDYQLNLSATLGYELSPGIKAGAGVRYGYGQERVNVAYKRAEYYQSTVYPDYVTYMVNGYGAPFPSGIYRKFENEQDRKGADVLLSISDTALGHFDLKASYTTEDQKYGMRSSSETLTQEFNDYQLNTYLVDLNWHKKTQNGQLLASLTYLNADGSDFNYSYQANNYLYNNNQWSAKLIYSKAGQSALNYLLEMTKTAEERQDGVNGNVVGYERLNIKPGIGLIRQRNGDQSWGLHLNGLYSIPLSDRFTVPGAAMDSFTQKVIIHDYLYHTSSFAGGSLSGDYSFPSYKKIQTSIRASVSYQDAFSFKQLSRLVTSTPGSNRVSAGLSLNFYF